MSTEKQFIPLNIAILVVSDTRTDADDTSGKTLVDRAIVSGHYVLEKRIVPDDIYQIRSVVSNWIAANNINVVISTGGTGVTGRDGTPEAVLPLLDRYWMVLARRSECCLIKILKLQPYNQEPLLE